MMFPEMFLHYHNSNICQLKKLGDIGDENTFDIKAVVFKNAKTQEKVYDHAN